MATFLIPTDVTGGTILVSEGDVFIFEAGAASDVTFESATGLPTGFTIQFTESNANAIKVQVKNDLTADVTIADNVDLSGVQFSAPNADSIDATIGDNVTIDKFETSGGDDTVEIGDNFTSSNDVKLDGGDDFLTIGENSSAPKFDMGGDTDTVVSNDPGAIITNAETILSPDGVVTGTGGDDVMGVGYSDAETDQIDAEANTIVGLGGGDTISGGGGTDVIHGDYTTPYQAAPAPAAGAEIQSFAISDGDISSGEAKFNIDTLGDKSLANDVTVTDTATTQVTSLTIEKLGGSDGETDVVRVDLSTFDGDFTISLSEESTEDFVYLLGAETETDNGDGTFSYTYVGADDNVHTVTVDPGDATVVGYQPQAVSGENDDVIDGGAGDDTIHGGGGDDTLTGGDDADTFVIEDGFGADVIIGGEGGDDFDVIDLSNLSGPVTVTYSGDAAGSITDGVDTLTFSEVEQLVLTDEADTVNAVADNAGIDVDAGAGDDFITGGGGADTVEGGLGADTVDGGAGQDSLAGGHGADSLAGGADADTIDGGSGDDTIEGGDGEDVLTGGDLVEAVDSRIAFKWSDVPDPDDGGQIDDVDAITTGSQTVGGTTVTFDVSAGLGEYDNTTILTAGIDSGDSTVDTNSALGLTDTGGTGSIEFSTAVENLEFRVNDFEVNAEVFELRAYDADGNPVAITATEGSTITSTDSDGDGFLEYQGSGSNGDNNPLNSILFQIAGPVARIEFDHDSPGSGSLTVSDLWFDDPAVEAVAAEAGGNDVLDGGAGDDTLDGGDGDDTLTGGDGDDVFTLSDGHDTITDFNFGNTGSIRDGDDTNNDFIDLSGHYDDLSELRADYADDGVLNQSNTDDGKGNATDYSDNTQFGDNSITMLGAATSNFTVENTGVVCFTSGAAIRTPRGDVPIDDLRVGDMVSTMDNGPQRIVWIGKRRIGRAELAANERLRPILIREGAFGAARDLLVSRQHGMMIGEDHLARAAHLAETAPGVRVAHGKREVVYIHLMFEAHQIIFAENIASESFYPGPMALKMLGGEAVRELHEIFPELAAPDCLEPFLKGYGDPARDFLRKRHIRHRLPPMTLGAGGGTRRRPRLMA